MRSLFKLFAPEPVARAPRRPAVQPAGVPSFERVARTSAVESGDWTQVRSPARPRDQALTDLARAWAAALPSRAKPQALLEKYPRLANKLALCWTDRALAEHLFDDLLMDHRGHRKGFPALVADDLKRLHAYFHSRVGLDPGSTSPWSTNAMAVVDR